jgi:excisionase family DNA binding protein
MDRVIRRHYYTVFEATVLFGLPESAIRSLVKDGTLPGRRLGRRLLLPVDEIDTLLANLPIAARPQEKENER